MDEKTRETLRQLCDIPGVSGDEGAVCEWIIGQIKGHCDYKVDPAGNLLVWKQGAARAEKKLLFSAHMDEVGFIVTMLEDSGLLRFSAIGGIDSRVVVGKAVEVGAKRIYGVIGTKAVHLQEDSEKEAAPALDKLYIDIGARSKDETAAAVSPGDRAVFHAPFGELGKDKLLARALDNRAGCALLIDLIQSDLPYDCMFSFTVQEETGCTGAVTAGYSMEPDVAIIIETTTASDIPGVEPDKTVCKLGAGPVLSFMDKGTIYDPELYNLALAIAEQNGVPCQSKQGVYGGNESRSLQTARRGAKVLAINLPCRYLHSPSCVIQKEDYSHARALLRHLLPALARL